jgi:hypothetical protein
MIPEASGGHSAGTRASPRRGRGSGGPAANTRLTASTAAVLFVLLAVEGVTILQVGALLTPHVFIGMLLVPPVLLKMGSTIWRFGRYYRGDPDYRQKGPPPAVLRLLGPVVILLTAVVFATGLALLIGPPSLRSQMGFLHRASFIVWLGVLTIHVLGHVVETARIAPRDWVRRTRRQVDGAGARQWALAVSLVVGLLLALAVVPQVGHWRSGGQPTAVHLKP